MDRKRLIKYIIKKIRHRNVNDKIIPLSDKEKETLKQKIMVEIEKNAMY